MGSWTLENEIAELIERKAEGSYWDFKQEWYSNNAALLHDIICMANSPANRDCYIIIGVMDKTYDICGVSLEKRKNQQNVIDLLRQKPKWAGGYIPEVYVKTVIINEKEIDVIVIKQSDNTHFIFWKIIKTTVNVYLKALFILVKEIRILRKQALQMYMTQSYCGREDLD